MQNGMTSVSDISEYKHVLVLKKRLKVKLTQIRDVNKSIYVDKIFKINYRILENITIKNIF
jgi:hypothetical protein